MCVSLEIIFVDAILLAVAVFGFCSFFAGNTFLCVPGRAAFVVLLATCFGVAFIVFFIACIGVAFIVFFIPCIGVAFIALVVIRFGVVGILPFISVFRVCFAAAFGTAAFGLAFGAAGFATILLAAAICVESFDSFFSFVVLWNLNGFTVTVFLTGTNGI